ncbi:MAG: ATP-binding protein [Vicinamibacterales bacterium]
MQRTDVRIAELRGRLTSSVTCTFLAPTASGCMPLIYNDDTGMPVRERPTHYAYAIGLTLAALGFRWALAPLLGTLQPYAPGIAAIAASVLFWGWRPAVASAIVAFLGAAFLFERPGGLMLGISPQSVAASLTFAVSAGLIILVGHRARLAEQRLAEANAQLREADRRKDHFLATLSHELRNPIGVIAHGVAALQARDLDPRAGSIVAILGRQVSQIRRLVDDLLDVSRIARGRMALHTARTDIRPAVEQAVEGCQDAVDRKQQSLVVSVPHHPVALDVDTARITQVLSNLIDNASKYSQPCADIRVNVAEDADGVVIDVSDNGPGIAPEVLPHVFDLFDQGGPSASEGLGLGLGLCKRIVEMHGGTIAALPNTRACGTSFVIRLPKPRPELEPAL